MAARRISSGVSARRFKLVANQDVHHTTVVRWEIIFVSCIMQYHRSWYLENEAFLYEPLPGPRPSNESTASTGTPSTPSLAYRHGIHVHRGDATNATHQKSKLHITQTRSSYTGTVTDATEWSELKVNISSQVSVGDLLEVKVQKIPSDWEGGGIEFP